MTRQKSLTGFVVTCAFLVAFGSAVHGQETSPHPMTVEKRALITELLEVMETKRLAASVYRDVMDQMRQISRSVLTQTIETMPDFKGLPEELQEKVRKKMIEGSDRTDQRVQQLIAERIDYPAIIEEISYKLYDKHYTEAEIKDLIAFHRSPTGRKAVEVTPKLFAESMELARLATEPKMLEIITILSREEAERVNKEIEELKAVIEPAKPAPAKKRSVKRRRP